MYILGGIDRIGGIGGIIGGIVGICVLVALYIYRKKIKRLLLIAYYEIIYGLLGCVSVTEDGIFSTKNKIIDLPKKSGEVAIVTGGSRGIGLEVVRKLLQCDMHVIIGCRNVEAGLKAVEKLRGEGVTSGITTVEYLDTSSLKAVRKFANEVLSKVSHLHLLINNAGIMMAPYSLTEDGFESHLGVNYMGHAFLVHLLLPLMIETGKKSNTKSRIVNVSSCAHICGSINFDDVNYTRSLYIPNKAYAQSKLAQLLFSNVLEKKLKAEEMKVSSFAVHPGVVNTDLMNGTLLKTIAPWVPKLFFKTPEQGSRSVIFTALSPTLEGQGGIYISNCRETWTSKTAKNVNQQEKLLKTTMELLKIDKFGFP